jgi:hypothetical protein
MSNRSARIDRVHNEEIRTEIAERLRIFLSKDQSAMPTRFRKQLNDLVRKGEVSPSIVPEAGRNVSTILRQSCLVFRLERLAGGSVD